MRSSSAAAIILYSLVPYAAARSAYRQRRLATASAKVDEAIRDACSGEHPLEIPKLFQLNRRQLDEYQLLTRKQQRSAFVLAQAASVVAFVVLVGGVLLALGQRQPIDKYVTGGLSALGSLLSGFLAATFFASHRDANKQMNLYYLEPQRTGRLLAVERVAKLDPPMDATIRAELVKAVLAWEMPAGGSRRGRPPTRRTSRSRGRSRARPRRTASAPQSGTRRREGAPEHATWSGQTGDCAP